MSDAEAQLREVGEGIARLRSRRDNLSDDARADLNSALMLIGETALALGGHKAVKTILDAAEHVDPHAAEWLDRQWSHLV